MAENIQAANEAGGVEPPALFVGIDVDIDPSIVTDVRFSVAFGELAKALKAEDMAAVAKWQNKIFEVAFGSVDAAMDAMDAFAAANGGKASATQFSAWFFEAIGGGSKN